MTIQQCRYVLAIARAGSMNEAAKKLLVSQASLSAAVRDVEDEFGIRIFDRSNKGVRVTREGAEFVRYARQLVAQVEAMNDRYHSEEKKSVRNFAVTAQHYDFVAEAFVSFMKKFRTDYNLSLKESRTAQVIEDVITLRSDLGILAYMRDGGKLHGAVSPPQRARSEGFARSEAARLPRQAASARGPHVALPR